MGKKVPVPDDTCKSLVGKAYELGEQKLECSPQQLTGIWDEVKELVCKELEKGGSEEEVETVVCTEIEKKFPVPDDTCKSLVGKAYELGEQKLQCSPQQLTGIWDEVKELVCKELEKGGSEG